MSTAPLRILIIGNGGRESALAWKLSQSSRVQRVFVAPGNGGTANFDKVSNIDAKAEDYPGLVRWAKELSINLVVPGPDQLIVDGIEEYFRSAQIPCFAPSREAAKMEGSKAYAKAFMLRHNIPTAKYEHFTDFESAESYINNVSYDIVIKASGLAAGKGVILPQSKPEAVLAVKEMMLDRKFGDSGLEVVIEEFLDGEELSILTFSDGEAFKSLPAAQDHKRIYDGDQGPNTGGMGCYAPGKIATPALLENIDETILRPTINGLRKEGTPFVGMLFTGLMITSTGPKVLEYNARFGDPETQTLLPLLGSETDLAEIMLACIEKRLSSIPIHIMTEKFSVVVVVVSGGYPGDYRKGLPIQIDDTRPDLLPQGSSLNLFHAGTSIKDGTLKTSGGRVIAVSATADTLETALKAAYAGVSTVHFENIFFRKDIGHR
ncbi:hypothetical protein MMC07_001102 [Pseudocyphellaria aurata]|nr:hypothetical protein [Pseudocyphellaria aurata]